MAEASQESRQLREEQARRMEEEVHRFMEQAGGALDRQMGMSRTRSDRALSAADKDAGIWVSRLASHSDMYMCTHSLERGREAQAGGVKICLPYFNK